MQKDISMWQQWYAVITEHLGSFLFALAGALILWVVGNRLIAMLQHVLRGSMERKHVDPTLVRYADSALGMGLNVLLFISVLSTLGVQTSTFAAVLAAAGVAIGLAWSGLLSHMAAGIFLIVLRPFKVGDSIAGAGVTGTVREIGMFVTSIDLADNTRVYVGNNKLFSDNIVNYSTNDYRRVDLKAQLDASVNVPDAIAKMKAALGKIPNVMTTPEPVVDVLEFTAMGPVLAVRPFCHTADYMQVFFDANRAIINVAVQCNMPVPASRSQAQDITGKGLKVVG